MIDFLAKVHGSVILGVNTQIWAYASIHEGVELGDQVSVGEHVYIGKNTKIGDRTRIGQGAYIVDHMVIGNGVFIAPQVVFCNDRHPRSLNPDFKMECPEVENDVSIGANATILPGVRLGKGCVVGAGAVVVRSVAPGETVVGNPARALEVRNAK